MVIFNELLAVNGFDPAQVALLRHSGTGALGVSPYDLWKRADGSFDRYQRTQEPGKKLFARAKYWASFVSTPDKQTLLVGLYNVIKGDSAEIDWECPIEGGAPGAARGRPSDLFHIKLESAFAEHHGTLLIDWGKGAIGWGRYAARNVHAILSEVDLKPIDAFASSNEGERSWQQQRTLERDSRLAGTALARNAAANGGDHACEACGFRHEDRALFDAHHPHPLLTGPRMTRVAELEVLCPTCHRRAHRSANRLLPFSLQALREWNQAGRP